MDRAPELLFLGTGAADWPVEYGVTKEAARNGQVRGNASLLVRGRLLIDCGPTVPDAMALFGVEASQVTDLLLTHGHSDHLDPAAVTRLADAPTRRAPLRLHATADSAQAVATVAGVEFHEVMPGAAFSVAGLMAHPLPANHVVEEGGLAVHYLLEDQGRSLLYATDGAWLLKPTWQALQSRRLTTIVWDATNGETAGDWRVFEHNSVDMIRLMLQTLRQQGVVDAGTQLFLTHMARTLCVPHHEMAARLGPEGLTVAHDGLAAAWGGG